jgi:hypothetical protein
MNLIKTIEGTWFIVVIDNYGNTQAHLGPYATNEEAQSMMAKIEKAKATC